MRISKNWLCDYVNVEKLSAEEFAELVTTKVAEVDEIEEAGADIVLVIDNKSLTHRPDLWGHFGFARELAAILKQPLKISADRFADGSREGAKLLKGLGGKGKSNFSITIHPKSGCRRFTSLEFQNVQAQPSPQWMQERLEAVGAGVRNLLVDLSNYVMHDVGQPNHAYDADKLEGSVVHIRNARKKEKFIGLDEVERELSPEDIVIADSGGAIALGGVIGGGPSSVSDTTTRLLLESANFDPVRIRSTTKRHQLRTDASNRFEKNQSPYAAPIALHRFSELLLELQPDVKIIGSVVDSFAEQLKPVSVLLDFEYVQERLSPSVQEKDIRNILESLGFGLTDGKKGAIDVSVPYFRATRDIQIPDDLVEEVGRIYGYERIEEKAPLIISSAPPVNETKELEYQVRDALSGAGFSEISNYSFMNEERAGKLGYSLEKVVRLVNPVDSEESVLRTSLVPGMIRSLDENARFFDNLLLFEIGRGYDTEGEQRLVCLGYSSGQQEESLSSLMVPSLRKGGEFYGAASVVRSLVRKVTQKDIRLKPIDPESAKPWMHSYRTSEVFFGEYSLGVIAQVQQNFLDNISQPAVVAELDLELLLEHTARTKTFTSLPKFPDSFFEMSVVMRETENYAVLEDLIRKNVDNDLLKEIEVLAVYQGKPLAVDEKSVSVKLFLGADDRTLSGEELTAVQEQLMETVEKSEFRLRS